MSSALIDCLRDFSKIPSETEKNVDDQTSAAIIEKWKSINYTKKFEMQVRAEEHFNFDIVTSKKARTSNVYVIENAIQPKKESNLPIVSMRIRDAKTCKSSSVQDIFRSRCNMASFLSKQSTPLPTSNQTLFFAQYISNSTIESTNDDTKNIRKRLKAFVLKHKSSSITEDAATKSAELSI